MSIHDDDTQDGKFLKIETVLDTLEKGGKGDALLLVKVDGKEGVSMPFYYDATLYRDSTKPEIDPRTMLNTPATLFFKYAGNDPPYVCRRGVIASFTRRDPDNKVDVREQDFFVKYTARIVPAFAMMDYEVRFRVFENLNVIDIIKQALFGFPNLDFDRVDFSNLEKEQKADPNAFPILEYCVQFGESSFNFVSRLMAEYGIWYFFGHPNGDAKFDADNDTMVLSRSLGTFAPTACLRPNVWLTQDPPAFDAFSDAFITISDFRRGATPVFSGTKVGNFNPLAPTKPVEGGAGALDRYNMSAGDTQRFQRSLFPAPVLVEEHRADAGGPAQHYQDAHGYASLRMLEKEALVFSISGVCRNPTFIPGSFFRITFDRTVNPPKEGLAGTGYVLTSVQVSAFEMGYKSLDPVSIIANLFGPFSGTQAVSVPLQVVAAGIKEYSQLSGGLVASLESLIPALPDIADTIKKIFDKGKNDCAFNFTALPLEGDALPMPLPAASRPIAYGPHLATVIGPEPVPGINDAKRVVYADRLGRVRVRFPWAPEGYVFADDNPACWVRVSQGWAGQGYGSQFLPRIGDEVVVEFLDGDPDRPIITGRVYNADRGPPNLAFASPGSEGTSLTADDLVKPTTGTFTRTGIRTRILPPGEQTGFHMLRFDDTSEFDQVQTLLRSQGRLDVTALNSTYATTHGNRHIAVTEGKDKSGKPFGGANFHTVAGEYDLHIGGCRYEMADKQYQLSVKGDTQFDLKSNWLAVVGGALSLNADAVVIEAGCKMTLKVGGSTIVMNPAGVYIDGPMIYQQCNGSADQAQDLSITDVADATRADPGEPPNWLEQHRAGGGGARRSHAVPAVHGPGCTLDGENKICVDLDELCGDR